MRQKGEGEPKDNLTVHHIPYSPYTILLLSTTSMMGTMVTKQITSIISRYCKKSDLVALIALIAIPILTIGIPALLGHPLLPGDDLRQGLPLRVLAGYDIAHGHLPLWNPYTWSGTPLLGSFVAGSFYPTTLLFAILPPLTAWTFNLIFTYSLCASGTYLLARKLKLAVIPSLVSSAAFSFLGVMSFQSIHVEIIDGYAWIPWFLLGIEGMRFACKEGNPWQKAIGWTALSALAAAMAGLSGSPDALKELALAGGIVTIWHFVRAGDLPNWVSKWKFLALVATACIWGAAGASAQIIPGILFQHISQVTDGSFSYAFGFLALPFWGWLFMLVPGMRGGNGNFSLPLSTLPIDEWAGYVGLLPLAALGGLLTRSFGRRRNRDKDDKTGEWLLWIVLIVAGILAVIAPSVPGLSLLSRVPLYGATRIQSRSLFLVDIGLAMVLGFYLDRIERTKDIDWIDALGAVSPMLVVLFFVSFTLIYPAPFDKMLGIPPGSGNPVTEMAPFFAFPVVMAIEIAVFTGALSRLTKRIIDILFIVVLFVDCIFLWTAVSPMGLYSSTARIDNPSNITEISSIAGYPHYRSITGESASSARVAISTSLYMPTNIPGQLKGLSFDENILESIPSVQGYGALVWKKYDAATCTHQPFLLSVASLASTNRPSTFDDLDLGTLITGPGSFTARSILPVQPTAGQSIPRGVCPTSAYLLTPFTTGSHKSTTTEWFIGSPKRISQVLVTLPDHTSSDYTGSNYADSDHVSSDHAIENLKVSLLTPKKGAKPGSKLVTIQSSPMAVTSPGNTAISPGNTAAKSIGKAPPTGTITAESHFSHPATAVAVEFGGTDSQYLTAGAISLLLTNGNNEALGGALTPAVRPADWSYLGTMDGFSVYHNLRASGHAWLIPTIKDSWIHIQSGQGNTQKTSVNTRKLKYTITTNIQTNGTEIDHINASSTALLVRSETWAPGWHATIRRLGSTKSTNVTVKRYGIIQSVIVPEGISTVTFSYWPPGMTVGMVLSLLAFLGILSMVVVLLKPKLHKHKLRGLKFPAGKADMQSE